MEENIKFQHAGRKIKQKEKEERKNWNKDGIRG